MNLYDYTMTQNSLNIVVAEGLCKATRLETMLEHTKLTFVYTYVSILLSECIMFEVEFFCISCFNQQPRYQESY